MLREDRQSLYLAWRWGLVVADTANHKAMPSITVDMTQLVIIIGQEKQVHYTLSSDAFQLYVEKNSSIWHMNSV